MVSSATGTISAVIVPPIVSVNQTVIMLPTLSERNWAVPGIVQTVSNSLGNTQRMESGASPQTC